MRWREDNFHCNPKYNSRNTLHGHGSGDSSLSSRFCMSSKCRPRQALLFYESEPQGTSPVPNAENLVFTPWKYAICPDRRANHEAVRLSDQWRRQGGARGAGTPRPGNPHKTNWFVQVKMVAHLLFQVTGFFKAERRLTYVSRWSTPSTYHRTGWQRRNTKKIVHHKKLHPTQTIIQP